ncbi:TPA: ORC1-type DNA replication protein [Candidatus Woesearchaeota archaeon]|nr:ORC1-type DNA replication protein [Candidatus Woesearchaeota archaeon]
MKKNFFERFFKQDSLFINKRVLQSNYTPETIPHRDEQISQIAEILAPALKMERPSNVFIYGKTGTGKTLSTRYITQQLLNMAAEKGADLRVVYVNCKLKRVADTEYRLVAQLIRDFGQEIPATGLPTDEVYKIFFDILDSKRQLIILVLDEIDQLIKKTGDEPLYNLTRINEELKKSQISLIGISNDLVFIDKIDPRVKSSLSEEELVFPPYNALQIQDILKLRAKTAFKPGVISEGVIEKCAAYAAREHGDARRALELLRVAGEVAERSGVERVGIQHIDEADEKIEKDRVFDIVATQPKQFQATLYSILTTGASSKGKNLIFTGEIYENYKKLCQQIGLRPLTQRRVSDVIAELDMLGIINAKVISKGRYGRTREVSIATPPSSLPKIQKLLEDSLGL